MLLLLYLVFAVPGFIGLMISYRWTTKAMKALDDDDLELSARYLYLSNRELDRSTKCMAAALFFLITDIALP